jgi:thiamine biosynthesis lipoprotein
MDAKPQIEYEKFSHESMYTTFEILINAPDKEYASQAARAAFVLLDKLNGNLSRFIESSDVSRINSAKAGQPVVVSLETYECLKSALRINRQTSGAFDITAGAVKDMFKDGKSPSQGELAAIIKRVGMDKLQFDDENDIVIKKADGVLIDLGGIAKGYAIDKMAEVLVEWDIERALIHGGSSSVRALKGPADRQGWPISISDPADRTNILKDLSLENLSLSSSSLEYGKHIIDPGTLKPVSHRSNVWVLTADAAAGDALATAMMVMSDERLEKFTAEHPEVTVVVTR